MSAQSQSGSPRFTFDGPAAQIYDNTDQDVIMVTEDRLRLCLIEHVDALHKKDSWMIPLGIFITILISFLTSTPHDFVLKAAVWEAIIVICGLGSLGWLILSLRHYRHKTSIETLVSQIKAKPQ